jgi:hypothetical protein
LPLKALGKHNATGDNIGVDMKGERSLTLRRVLKISVHLNALKDKAKNFILEQATKAQRWSRGIALLFL